MRRVTAVCIAQGFVFAVIAVSLSSLGLAQQTTATITVDRTGPQLFDPATGGPVGGAVFNPCTGELVDLTGTSTITVADINDGVVLTTTVSVGSSFRGTGQMSRTAYRSDDSQPFNVRRSTAAGSALEATFTDRIKMTGPESYDQWQLRATFRLKIDQYGKASVALVRFGDEDGCTGRALAGSGSGASSPAAGLVAAYSFDEGSGTALTDVSGNGNVGTVRGARFVTGRAGTALQFDGYDDWVTVADSASLDLATGMTIEAWVKPTNWMSGWETVVLKERGAGALAYALYAHDGAPSPGGYAVPAGTINLGGPDEAIRGSSALSVGSWVHLAATYDGSLLRFYINGALIASRAQSGFIEASASPLRMGGNAAWSNEFFAGILDDVRIYNRALSAAEIVADLNTRVQ